MIARSLTTKIILFVAVFFFFPLVFLLSFRAPCPAVCREVSGRDEDCKTGVGGGEVREGNVFLR